MTLSATDAEQLVQLRSMLDRARAAASLAGPVSQTAAVVELDAVVERILYMVAASRNLIERRDPGFEALIHLVCEKVGPPPPHLVQIRNLHKCRNLAQHQGVAIDASQLHRFVPAVDAFVRALVSREYQVELTEVVLADAIELDDLANGMRRVDEHAAAGGYPAAMKLLGQMHQAATRRWSEQRALGFPQHEPSGVSTAFRGFGAEEDAMKWLTASVRELVATDSAETFAASSAETRWFLHAVREADYCDADDVVRARTYVFWWIVGWESFTRTWESNRSYRAAAARRLSRTDAQIPTKIHDIKAQREPRTDGRIRLRVTLADVPDDTVFREWQLDLDRRLRNTWTYHVRVDEDGTVTISNLQMNSAARFRKSLEDAIKLADREVLALGQQRDAEQADRAAVEPVLKSWQSPSWITASRWGGLNHVTFSLGDRAAIIRSAQWSALLDSEDPPVKVSEASNFRLVVEGGINEVIAALEATSTAIESAIEEANAERDEDARAEEARRTDWDTTVREAFWGPAS